ncbi:MAG: hypothetical protein R3F60_02965 [bacterium]
MVAGDDGRRRADLLARGWGAFAAIFGRPDVPPLVARLLAGSGAPLPIWIRPAVIGSASRDETSLQQGVLLYLVHRALPPALAGTGLLAPGLDGALELDAAGRWALPWAARHRRWPPAATDPRRRRPGSWRGPSATWSAR